ncbi:MAG: hypothetical protein LM583_09925 [Desulfurococcaceae archaeon]|nr:hypothetical protein [Desulfurococcaceae archaeon]
MVRPSEIASMLSVKFKELADRLPMGVDELEERLKEVGCSMYEGISMVFDHSDYVSDVINEECTDGDDEDEESECNAYSVTRYKMAWLALACGSHKVVAVLRNLVVIEKNGIPYSIAHYDLFNVIESEKLFENARKRIVAKAVSERVFKELLEGLRESMPFLSRFLVSLGMIGIGLKMLREVAES